jgi:putative restriction endonuclease
MQNNVWSDEELIVACYIYNSDATYSEKIRKALMHLGRNESSIKYRFGNFDFFRKGTGGFGNGGQHAKRIWDEYTGDPEKMALLAEKIIKTGAVGCQSNSDSELAAITGPMEIGDGSYHKYLSKYRDNQDKLRETTLRCSQDRCCVTGINDRSILVASHIKPWSVCAPAEMTDVHNALCLNAFHDRLFDRYRMTVSESMEIIYDPKLEESIPDRLYRCMVEECTEIKVNESNWPDPKYLEYHNNRFAAVTGLKV